MSHSYLSSIQRQFEYYKSLGEKAIAQVPDEQLFWQITPESNSMASIVKHLWGNMLSRWTNFRTEDGEKEWRQREAEFDNNIKSRTELIDKWEAGWECLFDALKPLQDDDLEELIYIRNQGHTITEAINRQLAHYSYHVGQLVFLARIIASDNWQSLSIPRGGSIAYNTDKFAQEKRREHFTDEFLNKE